MVRAPLALMLAALGVVGFAAAQEPMAGPAGPCQEAAAWHLHQAMRFSQHDDQAYHAGAADAALRLSGLGDDCSGWQDDAARPGIDGKTDAGSADAMQASSAQQVKP